MGRRKFRKGLVFLLKKNMALFKTKSKEVKKEVKKDVVFEALEEVKEIVSRIKKNSYSDFEYLKDGITRMLMQPEKL